MQKHIQLLYQSAAVTHTWHSPTIMKREAWWKSGLCSVFSHTQQRWFMQWWCWRSEDIASWIWGAMITLWRKQPTIKWISSGVNYFWHSWLEMGCHYHFLKKAANNQVHFFWWSWLVTGCYYDFLKEAAYIMWISSGVNFFWLKVMCDYHFLKEAASLS